MNKVTTLPKTKKFEWIGKLGDLVGTNYRDEKSAFIGECGLEDKNTLYLVTYACVSIAGKPDISWSHNRCDIRVIRFVDVNISVVERDDR